jgi:hypothetical protein
VKVHIAQSVHETITVKVGERNQDDVANVLGPRRIAALASLGVGGLGFIAAGITGGLLISANKRMEAGCPKTICTTAEGYEASRLGKTLLMVNTVAWGVGIAGAGVGTVLLLVGGKKDTDQPKSAHSVVIGPGFVGIEGSF